MNRTTVSMRKIILAALPILAMASSASAIPIQAGSSIRIIGTDTATTAVSINMATGLNFTAVQLSLDPTTETGSFAGLFTPGLAGSIVSIASFQPFSSVAGFYAFTQAGKTVSFDLSTVAVTNRTASVGGSLPSLTIAGTGLLHLTGFDTTSALFTLTTVGTEVTTFFASTSVPSAAIAEPVSMTLLAVGLAGLGAVRRRQR